MKIATAVLCFLLSLVSVLGAVDASGSLQDAPPSSEQLKYELPFVLGAVVFGVAGVGLIVWRIQQKRLS